MALGGSSTTWDITGTSSDSAGYSHYKAISLHPHVSSSTSPHRTQTMLHMWYGAGGGLSTASPEEKHFTEAGLQFRGLDHRHHGRKHGGMQADKMLEW